METQRSERRAHARVPHRAKATVTTGRGNIPAELVDMSMGGLGLRMATPVSPGEFIRIRVQLPTDRGPAWFDPDAVVSRVTRGSGADTVGVCFVSPSAKLSAVLEARTRDHLVGRAPRRSARKAKNNAEHDLAVLFRSAIEDVTSGFEP